METNDLKRAIIHDVTRTLNAIDAGHITALQTAILEAERIFIAGKGRTGLQMKAFAMRLMHLGLTVHVVDDITTPAIQSGDLLIIGSGSGKTTSLVRYAETVQDRGAKLATITGNPASPIAEAAQTVVHIPASSIKSGEADGQKAVLVMGSLFEHTLGLLCDLLIIQLMQVLNQSEDAMYDRHANLE